MPNWLSDWVVLVLRVGPGPAGILYSILGYKCFVWIQKRNQFFFIEFHFSLSSLCCFGTWSWATEAFIVIHFPQSLAGVAGPRMLAATKRFWEWVMSVVIIYTCTPTNQPSNQPYRPRRLKGERMRTQRGCTSCTYLREHVSEHYYFCDFYSDVVLHLLTASEWEKFVWSLVVE